MTDISTDGTGGLVILNLIRSIIAQPEGFNHPGTRSVKRKTPSYGIMMAEKEDGIQPMFKGPIMRWPGCSNQRPPEAGCEFDLSGTEALNNGFAFCR